MLITAEKSALQNAVIIADSIIQGKSINQVIDNCLFSVSPDYIEIASTDNDISIKTVVECEADEEFIFTCDGKKLTQILRELPDGNVTISLTENMMSVTSLQVKGNYKLVTTDGSEFPELEYGTFDNPVSISQAQFKRMIKKVIFSASHDSVKPVFNGLYILSRENDQLALVTSDSRRLSYIHETVENSAELSDGVVIPLKTVNEIYKLLDTGLFECSITGSQCMFRIGSTTIISRLIDGTFPDFEKVSPKNFIDTAVIDTKKCIESLKRVMVFTKEPTYKVTMEFRNNILVIGSRTPEFGEANEEVIIERNVDESLTIGINAQYLMDVLKEIDSYALKMNITGQLSPVMIVPEDVDNYISVIMPIQLKTAE